MIGVKDDALFTAIHDFFMIYLPKQRNFSKHTIRAYRYALNSLLDFVTASKNLPLSKVTFKMLDHKTILSFLDSLETKHGCSISTRNQRLNAIRSFFHYAANTNMTATVYSKEVDKITVKKEVKNLNVEHLSELAVKTILEQPNTTTQKGLRDQFLMILLYDTGARIQEILDVELRDLQLDEISKITLCGKGRKVRTVPLMPKTVAHIKKYLDVFHKNTEISSNAPLFYVMRKGQQLPMCSDNARKIIRKYGIAAKKITPEIPDKIHPHLFRHSRAMHLYQHGMDLSLVSQWLGHSQFETTLIYAYADTEHKRKAIENSTPKSNPLNSHFNADRYTITDEETLKQLCGLK